MVRWILAAAVASSGMVCAEESMIDRAMAYRAVTQVEVSPDGRLVGFVSQHPDLKENVTDSDLWLAAAGGGKAFQLTRGPKRDDSLQWSPSGDRIAFISDRLGKPSIWLIHTAGGEAWQAVTLDKPYDKLAVQSFRWLPDGSGFLFTAADPPSDKEEADKKDKRDTVLVEESFKYARLYRFKLGEKGPEKLTEQDRHVTGFDLAPDGSAAVFSAVKSPLANDRSTADLFLLNLADKTVGDLVVQPGPDSSPLYSPDGEWIAFGSAGGEQDPVANSSLWRVRPDGSGLENLTPTFDENAGSAARWAPDGKAIFFSGQQGVASRVFKIDVAGRSVSAFDGHDADAASGAFDLFPDAGGIAVAWESPNSPVELYRLARGADPRRLSSLNQDYRWAPRTERFRYESEDGWKQEAVLLRPPEAEAGKPTPLLVVIHGGPAGVHSLGFRPTTAAWPLHAFVKQGYTVFLPNPRGSSGFGEEFRKAVVGEWGVGDFHDIQRGVDLLVEQGVADPDRMGVMGWSYGGYMTAWTITQTDRFKAASVGAGITDAISMYGTQDIPDFFEAHFDGKKPWEDPEGYLSRSAIRFVDRVKTPTLIQHGGQDQRVPLGQAQEFFLGLKKAGVEARMAVYPRQGHGITEPRLSKDALERSLQWFNEKVLGIEPGVPAEDAAGGERPAGEKP